MALAHASMMWGAGRNSSPWKSPFSKWMTRFPVSRSSASALRIEAHCLGRTKWEVRLERRREFEAVVAIGVSPWGVVGLPDRDGAATAVAGGCSRAGGPQHRRLGAGGAHPQGGRGVGPGPVSYTHLTLPTIYSV